MKNNPLIFSDVQELHQQGHLEEAKQGYLYLLEINPHDVKALHYLAILCAEEGNLQSAKSYLEKAIELSPDDLFLHLHLANICKASGHLDEAEKILLTIIKINPRFSAAFNNLGTLYFAEEKWEEAVNAYQSAIEIQSDYSDAYYNLGLAYNKLNRRDEAQHAYESLLVISPQHDGARFQLSVLLMQKNQYQLAVDQFNLIEQNHPFHFETQMNLGACYLRLGWFNHAKTHYVKASKIRPDDTQVLFNLGVIAMQQGSVNEAIAYYKQALKITPDFFDAKNNFAAAFLAIKKRDLALKYFEEALRLHPHDEAVKHTIHILKKDKNLSFSPPAYIKALFNSYAGHYDAHMVQGLNYDVPRQMFNMVHENVDMACQTWDILDAGCGTGLCGELFKPMASTLTGVDLADKMLEAAEKKHIYDALIQEDIFTFLKKQQQSYDLILAGDLVVYFGDLQMLFSAVHRSLKTHGLFVFDAEINDKNSFEVTESGRFAHSKNYLDRLIQHTGFVALAYQNITIRLHNQDAVRGHLYLLRRV